MVTISYVPLVTNDFHNLILHLNLHQESVKILKNYGNYILDNHLILYL